MLLSVTMRHNLRLIKLEAIVTFFVVGAVETLYLQERGYTLGQIGLVNALQMTTLVLANVPLGYVADKTSRRMCNLIGDALTGIGIIGFALAGNLPLVIVAQIITGLGLALSIGADTALMKAVCDHLGEPFAEHQASNQSIKTVLMVVCGIGVGIVTTHYPTVGILLAATPFVLGAIISFFIKEVKAPSESAIGRNIKTALRCCWSEKRIRWSILTGSTLICIAGIIQDLAVPLAKEGGAPPLIASGGWSYYFLAWSLGAWLYKRMASTWKKRILLRLPIAIIALSLTTTAIDINGWTVFAFLIIGVAQGWLAPQLTAIITEAAPSELRATVVSIYMTVIQLAFIGSTLVVFNIASVSIANAMAVAFLLFVPSLLFWSWKLVRTV